MYQRIVRKSYVREQNFYGQIESCYVKQYDISKSTILRQDERLLIYKYFMIAMSQPIYI